MWCCLVSANVRASSYAEAASSYAKAASSYAEAIISTDAVDVERSVTYTKADSLRVMELLKNDKCKTALDFARQLLNVPYVSHTLEVNDKEQLVVNLRQLDCTTLVETATALALCAQSGEKSFSSYVRMLTKLRYRNGKLNGYTSRLHYFSDWIEDKHQMGIVEEIQSPNPPFTALQKLNIYYMSKHSKSYKALKAHPNLVKTIVQQEKKLTGRTYRYIQKSLTSNIVEMRKAVKEGDIIAITCSKPGLDIAHLGFAVWRKDGLHLLNASQLHKKVVEEPMTLSKYLSEHPSFTGIRIIRIK